MESFDLYKDIATRTNGDIYVGVVGPVRTGKSTFIKKFMEKIVLENIDDVNAKARAQDELPQSADGKTIMTTEPKFVPSEAVKVNFGDNLNCKLRMIDCVGYLVEGALGGKEGDKERLVTTPWSNEEIPFAKAAEYGTEKVIQEHSTIGIIVTTDGSITDISRKNYVESEQRVVNELKELGKPFVMVLNTANENSEEVENLRASLESKYKVPVITKNIAKIEASDIAEIMEVMIYEFPISRIDLKMPKWMQALDFDSPIISELRNGITDVVCDMNKMSDYSMIENIYKDAEYLNQPSDVSLDMGTGTVVVTINPKEGVFYKVISDECNVDIADDFVLISYIKKMHYAGVEYEKIKYALDQVEEKGYGVVNPTFDQMELQEPELMKKGGQYGFKLKANAPSLHIIKVPVETEVAPIVGTEQQSKELLDNMKNQFSEDKNQLWDTNLFGKSLSELVSDGILNKLSTMPNEVETKMQKTLGRIVNEAKGGVICILL